MSAESELAFVARLRDEASATAATVRRNLHAVGGETRADIRVAAKDEASRSLGTVERSLGRVSGAASHVGGLLAGLRGPATVAGAALGGMAALGLHAGLSTAAGMETAKISFTTMLGSAQKANAFLQQLSSFAAKTPFEFPELQTAASSLISAGINASKVIPIMTTLGDVTSGMGTGSEGVQRATVALQQMSAAGKITGEDLNQLRDAGIPVFDLLAAATGKTKAQVSALAQAGKLGGADLAKLMGALETGKGLERFSGLMAKQSASLSGQWSTLKDNVNMALAGMITPVLPQIKGGLAAISSSVAAAGPYVTHLVQELGYLFGAITDGDAGGAAEILDNVFGNSGKLIGPFTTAIDYAKGVVDDLSAVFANSLAPAFSTLTSEAKLFLGPLALARQALGFMADHGDATRIVLVALGSALLFGRTVMLGYTAITKTAAAAQYAYSLATGRTASAEGLATRAKIKSAAQTVKSTAVTIASAIRTGAVMAATAARTVAAWVVMGAQSLIQAARMAAAWLIAMGPIGWAIAAVIAVVALIITHWQQVKDATLAAWNAVSGAVVAAWNAIKSFVSSAVTAVVDFVKGHWIQIVVAILAPLPFILLMIHKHWDAIKGAFMGGVAAVIGFVTGLGGRVLSAVGDLGSKLWGWAKDAFIRLGQAERDGIRNTISFVVGLPGKIVAGLGDLGSKLWSWAKDAFVRLGQAERDGISNVVGWARELPGKVLSSLGNLGSALYQSGVDLIQGLLNGAGSILPKIGDFMMHKLPGWIQGPFAKAMGINSPSRVFAEYGGHLMTGLAVGIDGSRGTVTDAIARTTSAVQAYGQATGGSLTLAPVSVTRSTGVVVTLRHEVAFDGQAPAGLTASDVADVIARDPKSAAQIEAALAPARARASSGTLTASR